ncbi:MAG: class B sortase [Oscillospiraceae bacterium]
MKKVLRILIAACLIGLVVMGGVVAYQKLSQTKDTVGGKQGSSPNSKNELTALLPAENEADIYDNLDYAIKKNNDAVAWIEIPETDINNIVMQGDENDYYLRRNEDKENDIFGCYFADYECGFGKYDDFSQNTIIYGHSDSTDNPDGKRFAQLYRFTDPEFAKKVPFIYVSTPEGRYKFEIFSTFYTDTNFDYIQVNINEEQKLELANKAKSLSTYNYNVEPSLSDKILTLSTCTVKYGTDANYRFVIMAKLCPEEV